MVRIAQLGLLLLDMLFLFLQPAFFISKCKLSSIQLLGFPLQFIVFFRDLLLQLGSAGFLCFFSIHAQ